MSVERTEGEPMDVTAFAYFDRELIGRKNDKEKEKYRYVPWDAFNEAVKVLMEGAKSYGAENWKNVPDLHIRYNEAMIRHASKSLMGERIDPQYGLSHMAHAVCCGLFCIWEELHNEQ